MLDSLIQYLLAWLPFVLLIFIWFALFRAVQKTDLLNKVFPNASSSLIKPILLVCVFVIVVISVLMTLPINIASRGQLLNLFGVVTAAAIALSSTTFLGNIMAGMMLRSIRAFKPGDFIQAGEHFGRVSEWGLLHTEIQTEQRSLTTLPNLYLVSNPVNVVRGSGTIVSAEVSLGYDNSHKRIKEALEKAVLDAGLEKPFVLLEKLGDFSVSYKAAGFLTEVKSLISARSNLRESMLVSLHAHDIEIVSPTFMNQRVFEPKTRFMYVPKQEKEMEHAQSGPENIIFDKADELESIESIKEKKKEYQNKINEIKQLIGKKEPSPEQSQTLDSLKHKLERFDKLIEKKEQRIEEER
ncbi:MAG TPA: mechanosensitive ion channel [Oligoflexia bacterium]|nr:mechanosensitive ion channel [Oligoflexia bacterium]HMR25804.1 mechanosensitive ion channel [Oligoflexia bacterium]